MPLAIARDMDALSGKVAILNAGDGKHEHPSQALLDLLTLCMYLNPPAPTAKDLKGKKVAIVGDILHSRVALSYIYSLLLLGAEVMVCGPEKLIPKHISHLGVKVSHNLEEALNWCDVANMLRIQLERQDQRYFPSLKEYSNLYGLTLDKLNRLDKEICIMHPGPINRGVEISSDVADSKHSMILQQVENGVAVRMAVLFLLGQQRL